MTETTARIDWCLLICEIASYLGEPTKNPDFRFPCSEYELSGHLKTPRTTIRGWLAGSEPKHADGEMLILCWCKLSGKARTFVPIAKAGLSAAKVVTVRA